MPFVIDEADLLDDSPLADYDSDSHVCIGITELSDDEFANADTTYGSSSLAEPERFYLVCLTRRGMTCAVYDTASQLAAAFERAAADSAVINTFSFVGARVNLERRNVVQVSITTDSGHAISNSHVS